MATRRHATRPRTALSCGRGSTILRGRARPQSTGRPDRDPDAVRDPGTRSHRHDAAELVARREREVEAAFFEHPSLAIAYEGLAAHPRNTADRVQAFLGVERRALEVTHRRIGGAELRAEIQNFDQLREQFAQWLGYFDDRLDT